MLAGPWSVAALVHLDLDSRRALVGAVVPFHELIVRLDASLRHRQLDCAAGALQRALENAIDAQRGKARSERRRLAFTCERTHA
jgi:hypothetical protein